MIWAIKFVIDVPSIRWSYIHKLKAYILQGGCAWNVPRALSHNSGIAAKLGCEFGFISVTYQLPLNFYLLEGKLIDNP